MALSESGQTPRRERLLTNEEAAEALNVSVRFINRIVSEHRIRFIRVGRHIRIPESTLDELIAAGTAQSVRTPSRGD